MTSYYISAREPTYFRNEYAFICLIQGVAGVTIYSPRDGESKPLTRLGNQCQLQETRGRWFVAHQEGKWIWTDLEQPNGLVVVCRANIFIINL